MNTQYYKMMAEMEEMGFDDEVTFKVEEDWKEYARKTTNLSKRDIEDIAKAQDDLTNTEMIEMIDEVNKEARERKEEKKRKEHEKWEAYEAKNKARREKLAKIEEMQKARRANGEISYQYEVQRGLNKSYKAWARKERKRYR